MGAAHLQATHAWGLGPGRGSRWSRLQHIISGANKCRHGPEGQPKPLGVQRRGKGRYASSHTAHKKRHQKAHTPQPWHHCSICHPLPSAVLPCAAHGRGEGGEGSDPSGQGGGWRWLQEGPLPLRPLQCGAECRRFPGPLPAAGLAREVDSAQPSAVGGAGETKNSSASADPPGEWDISI